MKKNILSRFILLCSLCIVMSTARAQYVAIPDSNFGNWLYNNGYDSCLTGNSVSGYHLDTTCHFILSASIVSCASDSIVNLTGIKYFKNLNSLFCQRNKLTSLPALPASLYLLNCSFNSLTTIIALPPALNQLDCAYNNITSLPALPNSLRTLSCGNNSLTSLPVLPVAVQDLVCSYNNLTTLPVLADSLVSLQCSFNHLTGLPTLPTGLRYLYCNNNSLVSMPALPDSLTGLYCFFNQLTSLPTLPSLATLDCSYNQLSSLPACPGFLVTLYCQSNALTALPALTDTLVDLNCAHNLLTSLPSLPHNLLDINCMGNTNLHCLPIIYQQSLNNFYIDSTAIQCIPDRFSAQFFDVNPTSLLTCNSGAGCPSDSTLGINAVTELNIIHLYPNPNKGTFTLQTSNSINSKYTITDMLGHVITEQTITTDRQAIDMSGLGEGVYTLTMKGVSLRFTVFSFE